MLIRGKRVLLTCLVVLVLLSTSNQYEGKSLQPNPLDYAGKGSFSTSDWTWSYTELVSTESYDESGNPSITVSNR